MLTLKKIKKKLFNERREGEESPRRATPATRPEGCVEGARNWVSEEEQASGMTQETRGGSNGTEEGVRENHNQLLLLRFPGGVATLRHEEEFFILWDCG